ncbi:long-chain-fatty-acid--CoA ligase 4-like [Convolutriloba macropyga]|uniref:long-chain-fatty-acid--CoA ligase 4-like n=1 Tax=Convolutriloba macropyga TaxID=536237 RepID=UPI003F521734
MSGVGRKIEGLITNLLIFFGDVVALITYIPNYILALRDITMSQRQRALPSGSSEKEIIYDHADVVENRHSNVNSFYKDAKSVYEQWKIAVERFKHRDCVGYRQILSEEDEKQPNGKIFQKYVMGGYTWLSYAEIEEAADDFGRALAVLVGKNNREKELSNNNIVIFSETRYEWMVAFLGCAKYNLTVVTLYSTLSEEAVLHGIVESEASILVASADGLCKIKRIERERSSHNVSTIVWFPNQIDKVTKSEFPKNIEVFNYEQCLQLGRNKRERMPGPRNPASLSDLAVIMYTSGSTGLPKGVMLTNENLLAAIETLPEYIQGIGVGDTYIGYLPLAHVLELTCELICVFYGCRIGYSSPHTLSDKGTKIRKGDVGDAVVLRPTLLTAVPLVMDRIYKGVLDLVKTMSTPKRILFNFAMTYKGRQVARLFPTPIVDFIVFRKIKNSLGGRVRYLLSGGAPLSASTHEFMKICFSCPVIQGYGLTETTGGISCVDKYDMELGQVGGPTRGASIKLVDWEEGNYLVTDLPNPRGEIVIRSKQVAGGYYKNEEKTEEAFVKDSNGDMWFYSGDIGEIDSMGRLKIIDRKKDLVKLATGEYVSLGKVEMLIKTNRFVECVMVYAESTENYTVCVVVPNEKATLELATQLEIESKSIEELCKNEKIKQAIFDDIKAHGQQKKLDRSEMPQKMVLTPLVWTPDTGLVTDSFKLKRKELSRTFANELAAMYKQRAN